MGTVQPTQQPLVLLKDICRDAKDFEDGPLSDDVRPAQMSAIDMLLAVGTNSNGHLARQHQQLSKALENGNTGGMSRYNAASDVSYTVYEDLDEDLLRAFDNETDCMPNTAPVAAPEAAQTAATPLQPAMTFNPSDIGSSVAGHGAAGHGAACYGR